MSDAAGVYARADGLRFERAAGDPFWAIECRDVHKSFGSNKILDGLSVGFPDGMVSVLLGPSGTGKSVLVKHLMGLTFPDRGDVLIKGRSVPGMRMSELLRMRTNFGVCFQDGALLGSMSIFDNVAFPLRQHTDLREAEIAEIVGHRLDQVGLGSAATRRPSELSGGMRKRAGFARALVLEPEIMLFDEPDSGLDPIRTALLCELIQEIHAEQGGAYVVITHNIAAARTLGEYLAVIWKGRTVQAGEASDMFGSADPFVRQFLAGEPRGPLGMD
ncbi:ABC transporter ATP-binding protein [Patulibacter medicamentivorans]|uniref:ABC transporter ATP-binding protein n=1 Tax=Patulibacter medicamentivorans TaxID=1097667 RepID=H0E6N2_9ACTN|nr:ATP-binding cassette domain-containing protein [Patulibacter medicamentivorans]EHN10679.1 ABC transporter ATP-binding protein [Patulibacter medicamentivorans]